MKKAFKPIFSKKILGAVILIAQILFFVITRDRLYSYRVYIYGFSAVMSGVLRVWEINRSVDPGFKIIWIALIAVAPFFGIFLDRHFSSGHYGLEIWDCGPDVPPVKPDDSTT